MTRRGLLKLLAVGPLAKFLPTSKSTTTMTFHPNAFSIVMEPLEFATEVVCRKIYACGVGPNPTYHHLATIYDKDQTTFAFPIADPPPGSFVNGDSNEWTQR